VDPVVPNGLQLVSHVGLLDERVLLGRERVIGPVNRRVFAHVGRCERPRPPSQMEDLVDQPGFDVGVAFAFPFDRPEKASFRRSEHLFASIRDGDHGVADRDREPPPVTVMDGREGCGAGVAELDAGVAPHPETGRPCALAEVDVFQKHVR
jgi:hypothetical protein